MKYLRINVCLVAVAGLMAFTAAPAMGAHAGWVSCQENPEVGQWENGLCSKVKANGNWETQAVVETKEVTSSAQGLELTDTKATGGASTIKCSETDVGWIGIAGADGVSTVTTTKCERVSGACEAGKPVTAKAIDLPWDTELKEESGGELRDVFQAGGKGPGYTVECTVGGIFKLNDECSGKMSTKMANNQTNGAVEAIFDAKTEKDECSVGGAGAGEITGTDIIKQRGGNALRAAPLPPNGMYIVPNRRRFKKIGERFLFIIWNNSAAMEEVVTGQIAPNEVPFKVAAGSLCYNKKKYLAFGSCPVIIQVEELGKERTFEVQPSLFAVPTANLKS